MIKSKKRKAQSVEHRSTKRRKSKNEQSPIYSTRVITWEEQLSLPPRFHEERDVWPALKILDERGTSKKKEYLLEWEAHPRTGEVFAPTWEPAENAGRQLKDEWKKQIAREQASPRGHSSTASSPILIDQPHVPQSFNRRRRLNTRRIIPDSSTETEEVIVHNSIPSRTPTLTGSPGSVETKSSPIEISETQHSRDLVPVHITVPPAPTDKSDWSSLRASQFSNYESTNSSSPLTTNNVQFEDSGLLHKTPVSITESSSVLPPPFTSTSRSSLRSRTLEGRDRGVGVQRILDYQPTTASSPGFVQYSGTSAQQVDHVTSTGCLRTVLSSSIESVDFSGSKAGAKTPPSKDRKSVNKRVHNLTVNSAHTASDQSSQPWIFKSQISLDTQHSSGNRLTSEEQKPALSGLCARKTASNPASQENGLVFENKISSVARNRGLHQTGMAARGTRQSPRLQTAAPQFNGTSPRIAVRTGSFRSRAGLNPPEHSSPLAVTAELAESDNELTEQDMQESSFINELASAQNSANMATMPPTSIAPSAMHLDTSDVSLLGSLSQESISYDAALNTLPTPVQESIEEELISSAEDGSLASKASSSQESLRNELLVPQVDGMVMPTYPILGDNEYAIALPAEGKVQAIYSQTIKVKRKAILKFIRRRGSVNTAGTSAGKTIERNEMIELIGRLHDTTTHIDLGLPGIPTQYTIPSQEHAAYAEYAGSKFVFLGYFLEFLQRRHETIVIMAKSGATQDLLEEYLFMRNVQVRRHERPCGSQSLRESASASPKVELLSTRSHSIVELSDKPSLIIAFDASFENLDPQVKSLQARSNETIPVLHLLVTNSSEHVERCLPPSMPSPIRLRLLVRATYQAHLNLGGSPTIITNPSDEIDGGPMDLGDINRAVRKSPNRKLQNVAAVVANALLSGDFPANWTLTSVPELTLDELEDSPSTGSIISATPGRSRARSQTPVSKPTSQARNRSRTPVSRAGTPSARKRQLEIDTANLVTKRQRMTPVNEFADIRDNDVTISREQELLRTIETLRVELANEKRARERAEEAKNTALEKASEWENALSTLQRRYEKRTKRSHEEARANKEMRTAIENSKLRVEKTTADNINLRQQVIEQKKELEAARNDLKSNGGDIAVLELAREEARLAVAKAALLEKSLDNTKRDFEFLRTHYQDASNKAAELGTQVSNFEVRIADLTSKASEERRRLKELNYSESVKQHLAKISQLEAEKRSLQVMYKKLEDESKLLKRTRGVQTRGSSTAPGTPGQRSRQGSPAAGNLPPSGSRASVLRNER